MLEPLLDVLKTKNFESRTSAMATISALTATKTGRSQLRAARGLTPLLDVLLSASGDELQDATVQVLANLLEDQTDDWKQLLQNGAVFSLVGMLSGSGASLQENALTLLAMLCSHAECREQVADSGCMPALAVLLGSNKADVQRAALALGQQLCGSRRACDAMLEGGAAAPLAGMLLSVGSGNTDVVAAVLECLSSLANSGLTQAP